GLAGACYTRTADAVGVCFAAEGVTADRLEIRAGVQASTASDAVESFLEDRVVAHFHAAVVDQDEMEFAIFRRFSGQQKNGIGERRAGGTGNDGEVPPTGTGV